MARRDLLSKAEWTVGCCLDLAGLFTRRHWVDRTRSPIEVGDELAALFAGAADRDSGLRYLAEALATSDNHGQQGDQSGSDVTFERSRRMELIVVLTFKGQLHRRPGVAV